MSDNVWDKETAVAFIMHDPRDQNRPAKKPKSWDEIRLNGSLDRWFFNEAMASDMSTCDAGMLAAKVLSDLDGDSDTGIEYHEFSSIGIFMQDFAQAMERLAAERLSNAIGVEFKLLNGIMDMVTEIDGQSKGQIIDKETFAELTEALSIEGRK